MREESETKTRDEKVGILENKRGLRRRLAVEQGTALPDVRVHLLRGSRFGRIRQLRLRLVHSGDHHRRTWRTATVRDKSDHVRSTCSIAESVGERHFCTPSGLGIAAPGNTEFIALAIEISCTAADTPVPKLLGKISLAFS